MEHNFKEIPVSYELIAITHLFDGCRENGGAAGKEKRRRPWIYRGFRLS